MRLAADPAHAELVVEGLLHPGDTAEEGPLGEFTGYYGRERAPQPVIEVKALHYRRSPILTAALMAKYPSCEIGAYYAIMRSARILDDLERIGVPGVVGAYAHPAAASGWGVVVVSLQQQYAGHAAQVLALASQCPAAAYYTKWIIAVDDDVDPTDFDEVLWALSHALQSDGRSRSVAQHLVDRPRPEPVPRGSAAYGSKVLINACKPHRHIKHFPQSTLIRRQVYDRVVARWDEFEFGEEPPKLTVFHPDCRTCASLTAARKVGKGAHAPCPREYRQRETERLGTCFALPTPTRQFPSLRNKCTTPCSPPDANRWRSAARQAGGD